MKLILLFAICLCVSEGDSSLIRRFYLYSDITNKVCDNTNVAFGTFFTASLARCALWCNTLHSCASFFFSPATSACIGCNETYTSRGQLFGIMEGTQYYSYIPVDEREIAPIPAGCFSYYCGSTKCPSSSEIYSSEMTKEWCLDYCRGSFAVEQTYCHCNFKTTVKKNNCTWRCWGDNQQICGGPDSVTVYNTKYV